MSDPRLAWLASGPLNSLLQPAGYSSSQLQSEAAVQNWLSNVNAKLLSVYSLKGEKGLHFTNEVGGSSQQQDAIEQEMHLIKLDDGTADPADFAKNVLITNTVGDAVQGLYQLIHSVFAPKLLGGSDSSLASKLQPDMVSFETKLHKLSLLGKSGSSHSENETSQIKTVSDEVDYWNALASTGGNNAERASMFLEKLSSHEFDLGKKWETSALQANKLDELGRLIDDTQYCLSEVWLTQPDSGDAFSQARMEHLLHLITLQLVSVCKTNLSQSVALWTDPFPKVAEALHANLQVLNQWQHSLNDMVLNEFGSRWRKSATNSSSSASAAANGGSTSNAWTDPALVAFVTRLTELLRLRSIHEEFLHLLSSEDVANFRLNEVFLLFEKNHVDPFNTGVYAQPKWQNALEQVDKFLAPIEVHAATNLKNRLYNLADKPELLMQEFAQFSALLKRPTISQALENERKTLLQQLSTRLEELKANFESYSNEYSSSSKQPPSVKNQPSVFLSKIIWANQLSHRIQQILHIVSNILVGIIGQERFYSMANDLRKKIEGYARELFDKWHQEVLNNLQDPNSDIRLETSGKLMDLDLTGSGELIIHYSENLVVLLREVRQLQEYGYKIHDSILKTVATGEKYYKYGLKLKQVANFYNTIKEKIIPSQMGMLLLEAQKFERAIKDQKGTTKWNNSDECEKYVAKLMSITEELTSRNTKLKSLHLNLASNLELLLHAPYDLAKNKEMFMESVQKLKAIIDREQNRGTATKEAIYLWRQHWNQQLYKVFNFQYQWLLETLNGDGSNSTNASAGAGATGNLSVNSTGSNTPISLPSFLDIPVELKFQHKKLQFKPPFEDLRSTYYRNLKKYLDLPKQFVGFLDNPTSAGSSSTNTSNMLTIFSSIPERNSEGLYNIYVQAELLFEQLRSLLNKYDPWMALGSVDLETYTNEHLKTVLDWEVNFRALKAKKKESEKLPDTVKIGCFTISFASFKGTLEDQMHKFQEALLLSLKKSTTVSLKTISDYLEGAMKVLNNLPQNITEMSVSKAEFDRISLEKPSMQSIMDNMYEKDSLLRQMANVSLDNIHSLAPKWQLFLDSFVKFDDMLLEQKDQLRLDLENKIKDGKLSIDKLASRWQATKPSNEGGMNVTNEDAQRIISEINDWLDQIKSLRENMTEIQNHCEAFGMEIPTFEVLDSFEKEVRSYADSWGLFTEYSQDLDKMVKEDWIAFRKEISSFAAVLDKWTNKLKQRGQRDVVFDYLAREIKINREIYPVLQLVSADFLENEHFKMLFAILKFESSISIRNVNLGHFLRANEKMLRLKNEIRQLVERAQGEIIIREAVENLKVWADKTNFNLLEQQTGSSLGNTHIIREWKELFTQISDQQALVGSLKESPYFAPFAETAKQFEEKFVLLDEALHALNLIQRKYLYLEPIFSRGALPSEQPRFKRIDAEFRGIMKEVSENPNVIALTNIPDLKSTVNSMLEQLDRCQKALNDFLEEKRSRFPRFYFIGDDDLLEIVGQSENPTVIQNHLKKLFAGIATVEFSQDQKKIVAMVSSDKERVPLHQPVLITSDVEEWLAALSTAMESTLQIALVQALKNFDIQAFPSQILDLADKIHFTSDVEKAIQNNSLPQLLSQCQKRLAEYTSTDTSDENEDSKLLQLKIKGLVMDLIHNLDVIRQLLEAKVTSLDNWVWQKQLRFYLKKDKAVIRMVDAEFVYSYEYQGNVEKLVHTPLSDKCYLVLTQGMHLGYGGCPFGPAGTGKTESVKALAHAFGRQCLVFNCDEGIDFQSMGRIFTGLVKSGAWGCFDEFNRLKEDQLSAVSQQIQVIQAAIKKRDPNCDLLGKTINVNPNAAIFVTMNPASREYGGRSKLPHNLKQLFRDISMALPDFGLICQTILMAEGFVYAEIIGKKVTEVFDLSKQLLSQQRHYDWGLRAMKTVLRHAGQLIHQEKRKAAGNPISQETESSLLIGALQINTLSKLTYADGVRFNGLIGDVFPGCKVDEIDYGELNKNIRLALDELKLEHVESQIQKIMQLYEALHQRMGVVIVGPSGCGKSTMLNVLHTAMGKMGTNIVRHFMNPKALERSKLLGKMDNDTREWTDGVLTAASRAAVAPGSAGSQHMIIADGDVDPEWIESLNSVLDDNHLLTMPNGERIKFGNSVNFVFETHTLEFASPATVSRMGMIFLSENEGGNSFIKSLVASWIKKQDPNLQMRLAGWMEEMFYGALEWVFQAQADVVQRTQVGIILTGLSHLRGVSAKGEFCCALIRGLGCNLPLDKRSQFATKIWSLSGSEKPLDSRNPLDTYYNKGSQSLAAYAMRDAPIAMENISFRSPPVVNTIDVQRNRDMIAPWLQHMEPFILVGPEGAGKSLLLEDSFKQIKHCMVTTIHCSAQTNASHVLQKLNDNCSVFSTNKGRVYRPKEGERLILFLKDLNLPKPDKYDTIQLIEFLQQLVTYKGFYDDNLDWVCIEKIQIVGSMNPATTVGRHALSTRFTATVHVGYMTYPDRDQLVSIYTNFLKTVIACNGNQMPDPTWRSEGNVRKLTGTLVEVYEKVRAKFSVDDHRHYLFNPRDLTQWVFGLLRYDLLKENLLDVIMYESYRLFADRLVAPESMKAFETILYGLMNSHWKHSTKITDMYFTSLQQYSLNAGGGSGAAEDGSKADISVLAKELGASLDRVTGADFKELCAEGLMTYEREYKNLNMLLFPEILDHIALEDRVLSRPGGSLFLVGDAGVGRKTSITLVCHMLRIQLVSPNMSRKYDGKAFRTDLKEYLKVAGVEGKQILLYIEDHQIVQPSIIEDINSLLSAGEVAGLYTPQELEPLLSPLKEAFQASGLYKNLTEFFHARIRSNLHVVLSLDPNNPQFHARCESNPAIYTRCTILWMGRWSRSGMMEIPKMKLEKLLSQQTSNGQALDVQKVLDSLLFIHGSALQRGLTATPLSYCSFLDTYAKIFDSRQEVLALQKKHLMAGLQKLTDAAQQVDILSKDASSKAALVQSKQREADQALEQITQRMGQASERKVEVEQLQKTLGGEEAKLNVRKEQIQNELKEIQPILNAAREAVGGIKKDNLNEIRAFRMPPAQIHAVLCGVLGLMKQEDTSWQNMKKFLGAPSVKDDILNFDTNTVDPGTRAKVQALIQKNPDAFDKVKMMHVNVAAAPLAAWVQACVRYSAVLETIKPLRQQFEDASRQLDGARSRVKQCEQELSDLDGEVQRLKERFAKMTAEAETLKVALAKTNETLGNAQSLLGKLSGERNRWEAQVRTLSQGLDALTYNAMLAAGFTAYLGACPEDVRRSALAEWKEKTGQKEFDFMNFMSTESEFLKWKAEGLPSDNLSMENSLVILNSVQVPFIIDPNGSATNWLKVHLADKTLEVVMQQEPRFVTTVELAVRFGKTLIIQEVDGVLPFLFPIVRKDLVGQGPRKMVQIGEKAVDYNENFKLFLVTRDPAPDIPSNARALINEINFTVTRSGLEGQLLGLTLNHEKPQLEQKKSELLASEDKLKIQLSDLEKRLLSELAQSEGNILENKSLIESLNQTKTQSNEIATSLQTSKEIQEDLDRQREVYRPIANMGSILYFLVAQLAAVNNMYEFSLPSFINLFKANLANKDVGAHGSDAERARVDGLSHTLKLRIFTFITRSLFKADRLMFALHFVHCTKPGLFLEKEWEFFTGQLVGETNNQDVPFPSWASKDRAQAFSGLSSTFPSLVRGAKLSDEHLWGKWFKSSRAEAEFPSMGSNEKQLTPFQRILFIKCFRPDRLQSALQEFACESIGVSTISPPPLNLQRIIMEEVQPLNPILFICEGGADPTQELEEFAEKTVGKNNFYQVALGSGQTDGAMQLVYKCAKEGQFLLLKNLHLVSPWLYELEKTLKLIKPHPQFRLILTTEVSEHFPTILLQESLLISYESPPGVKQNLLRTYENWDAAFISKGSTTRAQLLFILAWFHAIVQERRVYLPQGWTKFYEFSFADLRSGADIIDNLFIKMGGGKMNTNEIDGANFPWLTVWGLFKFAIYGGRIDNDHDVRVLVTYLRKFFAKDILSVGGAPGQRKLTGGLDLPSSNNHGDFMRLINKLPDSDAPVLFSLPDNVEGAVQETQSTAVIGQLRKLAVSSSSLVKFDRDVWRTQLTPLLQLWEKYSTKDNKSLLNRPPKLQKKEEHYTPVEAFVVLENQKVYDLIHLLNNALTGLGAVVYSSGLLTPDIKTDGQALLSGQTPWRWARNWYGPSDPALWITEIINRKQALLHLLQRTDSGQLLNSTLNMGQLFTPKVFLNALRQQTARQTGKAIDSLKLIAAWDPALMSRAPLKVQLDGFLLQGCGFQGGVLAPLTPDAPSMVQLPPCTIAYIPREESEPYPDAQSALAVPVYVAASREEYVCEIRVPCKGQLDRWILSGAALFLSDYK